MLNFQPQFLKFHEAIKIDFDNNQPLREKRDIIVNNLRDGLKKLFPKNTPTFSYFNQGSYDLATGVVPLSNEDYDIDVGIIFNFSKNSYKPVDVKHWVHNALNTGVRTVQIKRPCVRVQYHQNRQKWFHIDLAIYSSDKDYSGNEVNYIAKGLIWSSDDKKIWEISEPFNLKALLKSQFSNDLDRKQLRRIIRYLKRWKDYNFLPGTGRPTGIALTACCYNLFQPKRAYNYYTNQYEYSDLSALYHVANGIIGMFSFDNEINVRLPVQPYNNLFEKMSKIQMINFRIELMELKNIITHAQNDTQTQTACRKLRRAFGNDFPEG
ncbi:MAG: cyclic GMP-AMP synthase DncV-like nucleotidyltransferase [Dolichospermum sp.]|jgi:hypothetical protein|nr:nucleotidyltransferase [Planktothrix agardhii 1033]